jgi:hypothetical protein
VVENRGREPGDASKRRAQFVRDRVHEIATELKRLLQLSDEPLFQLSTSQVPERQSGERGERFGKLDLFGKERVLRVRDDRKDTERLVASLRERNEENLFVDGRLPCFESDLHFRCQSRAGIHLVTRHRAHLQHPTFDGVEGTHGGTQQLPRSVDDLREDRLAVFRDVHHQGEALKLRSTTGQVVQAPRSLDHLGKHLEVGLILDDVVDRSRSHRLDGDLLGTHTGHHHDRRATLDADRLERLETGHIGKPVIE